MDALNSLNYDIDFAVNPLVIIIVIQVVLILIASRRGWGWTPVWVMLGLIGIVLVVGILTGLALIPDGVDIFTVLIGSIGVIIAMIYMIVTPKSR
ncbi:MAG: hypothetical protein FJ040_05880 [Chloroflexi bacterium]|nr:hypothetical protein [Chloroflexota bacterium]